MKNLFVISLLALALVAALTAMTEVRALGEGPQITLTMTNYNPNPVGAGGTFDAHIRLDNAGDGSQNVVVQAEDSYPFTATGQTVQNVTLGPYQTNGDYSDLDFTMLVNQAAIDGTYNLKIRYMPTGGTAWVEQVFNVTVTGNQYARIDYVSRAQLEPGVQTPINFTVTNAGNSALQNLIFSWSDANGYILPVYGDNTQFISYLAVGKSVSLPFTVVADVGAPVGLDTLTLNLNSQSVSNGTQSILSTKAGIFIGGLTTFDVSFAQSSAGQTSLSVANTGSVEALAVKVSVPQQAGYQVSGTNAAIVGNLNPGDYTLVSFDIMQRSFNATGNQTRGGVPAGSAAGAPANGAPVNGTRRAFVSNGTGGAGGENLLVDIEYTDPTGTRQTVEKSIPIQFRGGVTGTGAAGSFAAAGGTGRASTAWWQSSYVVGLLVLIIVVGGYLYYKQRRAAKK